MKSGSIYPGKQNCTTPLTWKVYQSFVCVGAQPSVPISIVLGNEKTISRREEIVWVPGCHSCHDVYSRANKKKRIVGIIISFILDTLEIILSDSSRFHYKLMRIILVETH